MISRSLFCSSAVILVSLTGCAVSQQSRFQMPFVPPSPEPPREMALTEAPSLPPNLYINHEEAPAPALSQSRLTPPRTQADVLVSQSEEALRKGKQLYKSGSRDAAREQFDRAIDLLFQASASPTDRQAFQRRFEETVDTIHRYDLAGLGSAQSVDTPGFEKTPLEDILEMTFPVDPNLKSKVKEEMQATVSQLPLSLNDSVIGFINFFSGRGRKTLIAGLERAGRYRPLISRILDEEGVPQELIYLAQAESGFFPRAVSNKQATGMWQFVQFRGRQYGLMQTAYSDDRLDPEKATRSAAHHLRDLYTHFGDWYLAIAAYNCGPGAVDRAVERTGYADFWELRSRRALPIETTNYVPIILALTIMAKNPKEYDLEGVVPQAPLEYDVAAMTSPTNLALVGDLTETPLSELQSLNPALLKNVAPGGYQLNVPRGTSEYLLAALQTIPADRRASWRMHKVEAGETLAMIGKRYGATPSVIAAANHLDSDSPKTGDYLQIPQAAPAPPRKPAVYRARPRRTTATPSRASTNRAKTTGQSASGNKPGTAVSTKRAATSGKSKPRAGTIAKAGHKRPNQARHS